MEIFIDVMDGKHNFAYLSILLSTQQKLTDSVQPGLNTESQVSWTNWR